MISELIESDRYENLHAIQRKISQHHLLQVATTSPILSEILMTKLASYVVLLLNWKVVRIMQSVYRILEAGLSRKIFTKFMPHKLDSILDFIHSGPLDGIESRRNIAWCTSLASIRNVWPLVNTLVNWNQTSDLWTCVVGWFSNTHNDYTNVTLWLTVGGRSYSHQLDNLSNKGQSRVSITF